MFKFKAEELSDAMDRLGHTADGRLLKAYLQSIMLYGIPAGQNSGAVHEGVGRLNLARELIELMEQGEPHAGDGDKFERPAGTGIRADFGPRGARRRVAAADE